jgi:DNA-binding CsgD family transcriptional regulator
MSKEKELERLYTLWDAVADFAASDVDGALLHLMETLCEWIDADNVLWVGAVRILTGPDARRDGQLGWRARPVKILHATPSFLQKSLQAAHEQDTDPGMTTVAMAATTGTFRVHRMRDGFVDFARFRTTAHYKLLYEGRGIVDRIWVGVPINQDAESYFLFDLQDTRRRFSAAEAALVGSALRGLKWFQRQVLLSHGLPLADVQFTAGQRRVLAQLLTNAKEADIARKLQLSRGTVHQYAVDLYRKLGVKGRAGLMALWLNG